MLIRTTIIAACLLTSTFSASSDTRYGDLVEQGYEITRFLEWCDAHGQAKNYTQDIAFIREGIQAYQRLGSLTDEQRDAFWASSLIEFNRTVETGKRNGKGPEEVCPAIEEAVAKLRDEVSDAVAENEKQDRINQIQTAPRPF